MPPLAQRSLRLAAALWLPFCGPAAPPRPLPTGYTFGFLDVSTLHGARGGSDTLVGQGQVAADGSVRLDIVELHWSMSLFVGDEPSGDKWEGFMSPGSYRIVRATDHAVMIVNPATKQYLQMDVDRIRKVFEAAMASPDVMTTVRNLTTTSSRLEPSVVSGILTDHYSVTQIYDMTVTESILPSTRTWHIKSTKEFWVASSLRTFNNPFVPPGFGIGNQRGDPGLKPITNALEAEQAKYQRGVPVRLVTHGTRTDGAGATDSTTTCYELTLIREVEIPASVFQVPSGYSKIDFARPPFVVFTAAQRAQLDSAMRPILDSIAKMRDSILKAITTPHRTRSSDTSRSPDTRSTA